MAYHLLFKDTSEWRLFWFFTPRHLTTSEDQTSAVLEVNKQEDERQIQQRNIQKVDEVIFNAQVGKATSEQLRAAGNPS